MIRFDADRGRQLSRDQQVRHFLSGLHRNHVGRGTVLRDMLVAREYPRDLREVHAVFLLQDAARPYPGRDGVPSVDADTLAFQVFRTADTRPGIHQDRAVMESAYEKD